MVKVNYEFAKKEILNGEGINHLKVSVDVDNKKNIKRKQQVAVNLCVDNSGSMDMTMNGNFGFDFGVINSPYPINNRHGNLFTTDNSGGYFIDNSHNPFAPQDNTGIRKDMTTFVDSQSYSLPINPVVHNKETRGTKMDYVKMSAIKIVESLNEDDYFGLVIFDNLAYVVVELQQIKKNKSKIIKQIKNIQTGGSTNMFDGIRKVEEQFKTIENMDILKKTIILSDGQVNDGVCDLGEFAEKTYSFFHNHNIQISAIGFGKDYNLELMSMLANKGEGKFYHLKESEDIYSIIEEELDTINSVVARNAKLSITIPNGLTFEENINNFDEDYIDNVVEVKLGNLYATKYMIFPIALLKKLKDNKLTIPISLSYIDNNEQEVVINKKAVLQVTNDKDKTITENKELVKEIADTLNRRAIINATVEYENTGNFANSTNYIKDNLDNLSSAYSSAEMLSESYMSNFNETLHDSKSDINKLRTLNATTMYDIKNRK